MTLRQVVLVVLGALVLVPGMAHATGFKEGTDADVHIQALRYDITVRGLHVAARMEVRFRSTAADDRAANLWFPLPQDAVIHRAEIYLPDQQRWEVAETTGRREGAGAYQDAAQSDENRLLIQEVGVDLYRARVFPVDQSGSLVLRVYYAHVLERREGDEVLVIAQATPDTDAAWALDGTQIHVDAGADSWSGGSFNGPGGSFDAVDGLGEIQIAEQLDEDIVLRLWGGRHVRERALSWKPGMAMAAPVGRTPRFAGAPAVDHGFAPIDHTRSLLPHTHVTWTPSFAGFPELQPAPRNVVFVVDHSGSMAGAKMIETRGAVIAALKALDPRDWFGLVAFDDEVSVFSNEMTSGDDIGGALEWVAALEPDGMTAIGPALERATEIGVTSPAGRPIDLLLMTDGLPNVGPSTADGILAMVNAAAGSERVARVFGCGIGHDLDQSLVSTLARDSGGEATFALDDGEVSTQILDLFTRTRDGGIHDARVQVPGAGDVGGWTRVFPGYNVQVGANVFSPLSIEMTGTSQDGSAVSLWGTLAPHSGGNTFARIAAPLAAAAWAKDIVRDVDAQLETNARVDTIVTLAKTYGIVTRYSSLIALDSDAAYAAHGVERLRRNEAGIAVEPVEPSITDESRIGGAGPEDAGVSYPSSPSSGYPDASNGQASGCTCTFDAQRSAPGWAGLVIAGALLIRRRRSWA